MPMGANKYNCIKWTMLELKGLLEDEDAHVIFQRSKQHIALHPFQVNDMNRALRENLSSRVNFYDHDLQGLVLAYKRQKLLNSLADILHDAPFIHVDMEADFYIFTPKIGCTLKGIANKKAGNHLGVLVHKAFNVSIIKEDDCEEWLGDFVYVGQQVKFTVTHLDFKGKLPFIRGKLIADVTMGQVYYDTINSEEMEKKPVLVDENSPSVQKKKSKKSHAVSSAENEELDDSVPRGLNGELSDAEESSSNREKIKGENSSKKKCPSRKKAAVETESCSEEIEEKPSPKEVVNKTVNGANSRSDSEDSSDHEETKRSIFSTKRLTSEQNRSKKVSINSESSDNDLGSTNHGSNVKKSVNSPAKNKLDSPKVSRNKSSGVDSDSSVEEKPRHVESVAPSKPRTSDEGASSPTKRSKKNHVEDTEEDAMSEMDVKPRAKVKKRKKKDEKKKTETEESPEKSTAHEVERKKVKSEEEEGEKKKKKSKAQESLGIKLKIEEEEERRKKKSKAHQEEEAKKLKNEKEEEERKKKKSKAHQDEARKLKNEEEEEERKKKKSIAHQEEARKLKNEEEEEERKKKKSKAHQDEGRKLKNEEEEEERKKKKSKDEERKLKSEDDEEERRKKKSKVKGEIVKDGEEGGSGFEFVKPDLDAFDHTVSKIKRKRRKTITQEEENAEETSVAPASDYSEDFFRDVRVKIEPDPSDVEDSMPSRKERKRKRKHSEGEVVKKRANIFTDIEIKQELMSDVEDIKSNGKKSKSNDNPPSSPKKVRVKMERDTSDVESPSKRKIKREPEESSKRPDA